MAIYDTIGNNYNTGRRADPYLTYRMLTLLKPVPQGHYLEIGCGTGNYIQALTRKQLDFTGIDPSETMLEAARNNNPAVTFINATAEAIPFPDNHFDGILCVLTLHHWQDATKGLHEALRVLKPGGRITIFSFTPEQMDGYWLRHYFPRMIERCKPLIPSLPGMVQLLENSGYNNVQYEKYFVLPDLQDHFLYACKHEPEKCLQAEYRDCTSAFRMHADTTELQEGLASLQEDILSGAFPAIKTKYRNRLGDYMFYFANKPE